jgi:hypothetical protein
MANSKAFAHFLENKQDVDQLWKIHQEFAGGGSGRKYGVEVLNRAVIVFITACWESFLEDLAREAFETLLDNAPDASSLPSKLRDSVTKPIFEQKNSSKVWDLAGTGWKALMQAHTKEVLDRWIGSFNTPKTAQVNTLYAELLGIGKLSSNWKWRRMPSDRAEARLDNYVTIRGNIAHRTEHDAAVYKDQGVAYLGHISALIELSEKAVFDHVKRIIGKDPW